jgi:hypothetical protein
MQRKEQNEKGTTTILLFDLATRIQAKQSRKKSFPSVETPSTPCYFFLLEEECREKEGINLPPLFLFQKCVGLSR